MKKITINGCTMSVSKFMEAAAELDKNNWSYTNDKGEIIYIPYTKIKSTMHELSHDIRSSIKCDDMMAIQVITRQISIMSCMMDIHSHQEIIDNYSDYAFEDAVDLLQ